MELDNQLGATPLTEVVHGGDDAQTNGSADHSVHLPLCKTPRHLAHPRSGNSKSLRQQPRGAAEQSDGLLLGHGRKLIRITSPLSSILNAFAATVALMVTLGTRIRDRREDLKMTQAALAKMVGVSRAAVSLWESGNTKGLKPDNLLKCADALRVSVRLLVTGRDDRASPKDLARGGLDGRIADLPLALHEHMLEQLEACEEAYRTLPFAFSAPIPSGNEVAFHGVLERLAGELRKKRAAVDAARQHVKARKP